MYGLLAFPTCNDTRKKCVELPVPVFPIYTRKTLEILGKDILIIFFKQK